MSSAITAAREMALCQFCQEVLWRPSSYRLEGALGLLAESWFLPNASVAPQAAPSPEEADVGRRGAAKHFHSPSSAPRLGQLSVATL